MTNKIYYQSKNPIACMAFANYIGENYNRLEFSNHWRNKITGTVVTTYQVYRVWENLEVDKTLAKDEIDTIIETNEVQYLREQQEYNNTGYIEPDEV